MRKHVLRWIPIALFLLMATISFARHLKSAAETPCHRSPEICQPAQQLPPCQLLTCPDADTR